MIGNNPTCPLIKRRCKFGNSTHKTGKNIGLIQTRHPLLNSRNPFESGASIDTTNLQWFELLTGSTRKKLFA